MKTSSRLMAVDDESDITFLLKLILEQCGFFIDLFNDPKVALIKFKANYYDLLLIDVKMPQMNGFQLYQEIANIDTKAKVYFFTAYEESYQALSKQFPNLKASCLISKPISILNLIKKIDKELSLDF